MKDSVWFSWTLLMILSRANATFSSGVIDARLVNGDRCSGHLEMKHQGQWRTLMLISGLNPFRYYYAEMACQQMGCGSVVSFNHQVNTTVSRPAWEVHFPCRGYKRTIHDCRQTATRRGVEDIESTLSSIFVECSEHVRLTSFISCDGKALVRSGENWLQVCESEDQEKDFKIKSLMCAELGCGNARGVRYVSPADDVGSSIIRCHGNETHIQECPLSHSKCHRVLHIECQHPFSLRVVGESRCRGRLEGKYVSEWRPLTRDWSDFTAAQLSSICRQLGCGSFVSQKYKFHDERFTAWELDRACRERELCTQWNPDQESLELYIACAETLSIINGTDKCSGQVKVKKGGEWRNLCQNEFSPTQSFISCRELECGFPQSKKMDRTDVHYNSPLRLNCSGDEERLADCPESSPPAEGTDDTCFATYLNCGVRPMPAEMTMFSQRAVVDKNEILVYSGHRVFVTCSIDSPYPVRSFKISRDNSPRLKVTLSGDNSVQFVFDEVEGNQDGRYHCTYNYDSRPYLFSGYTHFYLRVKESSYVRLVGWESRCLGALELEHEDEWRPVSQRNWGLKEATVVCKQLDCGSVIRFETQSTKLKSVWKFYSDCDGSERALLSCGSVRKWISSDTVHMLCSDIVAKPTITVLADRLYPENTERIAVHEGHGFFVNCTVEPRFPGGHFSLAVFGSELNQVPEAMFDYSALFKFSHVSNKHSGNYSCIYHKTVLQHDFTIESKTVTITVEALGELKLDDGLQHDDGSKVCSGTLLMSKGPSQMKMVTAESSGWDLRQASVVCRELGCGNAVSTSKIQFETFKPTWRFFSDCEGSEDALLMCGNIEEWFSNSAIQVFCAGQS